ncbi:MAG: response regulator transcription factor [Bacteroidota bacterium]
MNPRILVVEDEPHMQQGLRDNLMFEGYDVDVAGDGRDGLERLRANAYDLVLLDVMLPHLSGFDVCRTMRAEGMHVPVIMLTAKGQEMDKVLGLELGADDYVTKPFSLRELLARVKAALRRRGPEGVKDDFVRIGRLRIDFEAHEAYDGEALVSLTHLELEVLRYMNARARHPVSREELLQHVWGYETNPTTRTVDNFILKLRQKIETDPRQPRHLLTAHGIGYKLVV